MNPILMFSARAVPAITKPRAANPRNVAVRIVSPLRFCNLSLTFRFEPQPGARILADCGHSGSPHLLRYFNDAGELGPLLVLGQAVAFLGRGETALAGQTKLIEIDV